MSFIDQITVLILTYNEAPNIGRALAKLSWAKHILVVDSGSSDATLDIIRDYPQAKIQHRDFDDFAGQCNFGLSQITTEWVLSIDADYELTAGLVDEIASLTPPGEISGYRASFIYRVYGRALRGTLYPPRTVLYRRRQASYRNEGHGHRVNISGKVEPLKGKIFHDDCKSLSRWFASQQGYAVKEADFLLSRSNANLSRTDRIRRMAWPAPILVFLYTSFIKGCILDGWPGWFYVLQRTIAEAMIASEILDRRLRGRAERSEVPELASNPATSKTR